MASLITCSRDHVYPRYQMHLVEPFLQMHPVYIYSNYFTVFNIGKTLLNSHFLYSYILIVP